MRRRSDNHLLTQINPNLLLASNLEDITFQKSGLLLYGVHTKKEEREAQELKGLSLVSNIRATFSVSTGPSLRYHSLEFSGNSLEFFQWPR